jgi:hypothetical protein
MTTRPSTAAPILAVLAVVLVTLGAYVAGYLWLRSLAREVLINSETVAIVRHYPYEWQVQFFQPARKLEAWSRGIDVGLTSRRNKHGHPVFP